MNVFTCYFKNGSIIGPCLVALFISLSAHLVMADKNNAAEPKMEITWSETSDGTYHVFYTALSADNTTWSAKVKLSKSSALNVAPAISSGTDGTVWVAWSSVRGRTSQLKICFFDGVGWSDPEEIPTAGLTSNTGASIFVDQSNRPWIVWSGFDGTDDDIYFSRWDGEVWEAPSRIHIDNDTPDLLPIIVGNKDNHPTIFWYGFNGEKYVRYTSRWTGHCWSDTEISLEKSAFKVENNILASQIPSIPDFIKEPGKAVVHFRNMGAGQSIPLRELGTN